LVDPRGLLEPSEEKSVSKAFWSCNSCTEALVLVEARDVAASGYLRGDSLWVECSITVLRELPAPTIPLPAAEEAIVPPSTSLHLHFGELLQSGTGADVTFLVSGESFAAHKNILAARSRVFMAEFFGAMKEKSSQSVEIEDMEAAVFKILLHFIYTDTVPELEQQQETSTVIAQHLLAGADRYGLDRLKLICEAKLSRGITAYTAATTLALAEKHNCSKLKDKCVEFILSSPAIRDAVLVTEGYKHLAASCPLVLADLLKSAHGRKR
jgi:speckle-type POZ protein